MQSREIEEEVEEIILKDLISVSEVKLEMCVEEESKIRAVKNLKFWNMRLNKQGCRQPHFNRSMQYLIKAEELKSEEKYKARK